MSLLESGIQEFRPNLSLNESHSSLHTTSELLKQWVLNPPAPSMEIRLPRQDEEEPAVGQGFEDDLEQLQTKVQAILKRHRVQEFFSLTITTETITETRYLGRGRPTPQSPKEQVTRIELQLQFQPQSAAITPAEHGLPA